MTKRISKTVARADYEAKAKDASLYSLALHYVLTRKADGSAIGALPDGDTWSVAVYNVAGAAGGIVVETFKHDRDPSPSTAAYYWEDYCRFVHEHRVAIGDERWTIIGDAVEALRGDLRRKAA